MAFWGGGMGGWGGGGWGQGGMAGRGGGLRRSTDNWDDEELGAAYNHEVVVRLLRYVKPYWKQAVLSVIGVVGSAVLIAAQPVLIARGVDAAQAGDVNKIIESA